MSQTCKLKCTLERMQSAILHVNPHLSLAAQMWNLAINLLLMIGNKIPLDDEHWECFLLLLDILQLCTTKFTSAGQAGFLEALIHDHHHLLLFDVILKLT